MVTLIMYSQALKASMLSKFLILTEGLSEKAKYSTRKTKLKMGSQQLQLGFFTQTLLMNVLQ